MVGWRWGSEFGGERDRHCLGLSDRHSDRLWTRLALEPGNSQIFNKTFFAAASGFEEEMLIDLQTRAPGRGVENRKIPESGSERVQKVFWIPRARVSQESLAPCATLFCTVTRDFRALASKDLLLPLLTTFGIFLFSTPLPSALVCKSIDLRCG